MALREDFEREGNWLFRWRSYLPLLMLGIAILAQRGADLPGHGEQPGALWEACCVLVSLAGLGIRVLAIGHAPRGTSGRSTRGQNADTLNTTGAYSVVRNPLYLGNFLMGLGIALFAQVWWLTFIYVLSFCLYYERIVFAEEAYLREKFADQFVEWARRTPAFIPRLNGWERPRLPFSLRNVLRREYHGLLAVIASFVVLEVAGDGLPGGLVELDPAWSIALVAGVVIFAVLRTLKSRTSMLNVEDR